MTKEEFWQAVLAQIQFHISPANFSTWFKNTGILSKEKNSIIISVPNNFSKEWLENKYHKLLLKILNNLDRDIREIKYIVNPTNYSPPKTSPTPSTAEQLDFQELTIINKETNLNPRYTFENFVIGSFNELAHAAAWAVSKNPGVVYNPLFIYGGVGLGKTHLLQAIGNKITKIFPHKITKYIPCEKFASGVINSIRNRSIEKFKANQCQCDIIIIDDVQFLAGKEKTQEEFFHIFNYLYEKNKQIVLSSDRPPKEISALEERLRSRFEGGMIADIGIPDFETRLAILKAKAQEKKVNFSNDIFEYVAETVQINIRELEGVLNKLIARQKINNKPLDIELVKNLLKTTTKKQYKVINFKKIIQCTAEFYDLKEKDILSPSRKKEIVKARQIAMYLVRKNLKSSFPFIGRKFNGKDHTTAIHSCKKIEKNLKENEELNQEINLLQQRIQSV